MTLSTLTLNRNDFQREVAVLLGWPRVLSNWNNTHLQDFADLEKRALRAFYFPAETGPDAPTYEWTFLRTEGSISLATGDADYNLPDNFGGTILDDSVSWPAGTDQPKLKKIPEGEWRQLRAADNATGYPKYFSVRNKSHSYTAGESWEFLVYPTPTASQGNGVSLAYRYVFVPETLSNTNVYPVGGAQYGEVMLASYLAAAEYKLDDDPGGPFAQKFATMLDTAVRNDKQQKENNRGGKA